MIAIFVAFVLQLTFGSMEIGAIGGLTVMFLYRVVYLKAGDKVVQEGMLMMGTITFIMLIASGFANVLTETDLINEWRMEQEQKNLKEYSILRISPI